MTRFSFLLSLAVSLVLISGCEATHEAFSDSNPQLVAQPDKVSAMLADAADRASNALETLAAVEHARGPGIAVSPISGAPVELRRAMSINWVGPVEPITQTLADRAGYSFQTVGAPPPVAIVVSIDAENRPVIDILRDLGLQLGMRADIKVDGQRQMVEIHYPPNSGSGG